jgi:hypothetical protein
MLIRLDQMEIHLARMTQQMEEMKKRLEEAEQDRAHTPAAPGAEDAGR